MNSLSIVQDAKTMFRFARNMVKKGVPYDRSARFDEIQIETTSVCNRSCDFCPNSVNPPPSSRMSSVLFQKIADELGDMEYSGNIALYLRNEPFMDKSLHKSVRLIRDKCPKSFIYIASNGDLVTVEKLIQVFDAGMSGVALSAYDGKEQTADFHALAKKFVSKYPSVNYVSGRRDIHDHTNKYIWVTSYSDNPENFFNRAGTVSVHAKLKKPLPLMCTLPFKQLCVTATGEVALCCADWYAEAGLGNVNNHSLLDIWFSLEFRSYRDSLSNFDRSKHLCDKCTHKLQDLPRILLKSYF